ncbi:MAG: DNA mismatch repair endonuclease MutL [Chloroflexi bacterium]|nr:DNA mismatch repair endonuclease MutL [Chloroflexota bacterium]
MTIQVLPERVIAQIAAGEVVERPASVVKELIENALDAGASVIRVEIDGGGKRLIRVSDNGAGIHSDEAALAVARHATSKLRSVADLEHIETLGFRGEALASIAAVSHMTLTTRHRDAAAGVRLRVEGGDLLRKQTIGAPAGTVVSVENLFFNTPARLKFLKADNTEKRQVTSVITRYAMAYPGVQFVLLQDGVEIFHSSGSGRLADVLVKVFGLDSFKHMLEVNSQGEGEHQVYGYSSTPELHRADRSRITLFVNGRSIQDASLTFAVVQAYHTLLMTGRYPLAVLMLRVPPPDVDVNVHPTKAEVRFRDPNAVFAAVQRAVRRAVVEAAQVTTMRQMVDVVTIRRPAQLDLELDMTDSGQYQRQQRPALIPRGGDIDDESTAIPVGPAAPARPRTLPMLRVLGQISAAYIVAEGPAGMYLVDQHAAHERILYEQFMDNHERQGLIAQYALTAQTIQLAPLEARLLEEHLDSLTHFGFALEAFGPNTFAVRSVPALLADKDPTEILRALLQDLEAGKQPGQRTIEEKIILRVCKQAAVKAGQILSLDEMQGLIRALERCRSPLTCPHGRPTLLHMSSDHLAREFGRLG